MLLWILLALVLGSVIYLLFAPLILSIDTLHNEYYIRIRGLIIAMVLPHEEEVIAIKLKVFFLQFNFYPLKPGRTRQKKELEEVNKKKKVGKSRRIPFRKILRLIRSFKIKKLKVDLDTGDPVLNAKLYPVFALLNYKVGDFQINFMNRNRLVLKIENRPIYLIKSFMNF